MMDSGKHLMYDLRKEKMTIIWKEVYQHISVQIIIIKGWA